TAIALYSGFTVRLGHSTDSTMSGGDRHRPILVRSGPTVPPRSPTLWHDKHADVGMPKTTAPRRASPCVCASVTSFFTSSASYGPIGPVFFGLLAAGRLDEMTRQRAQ